MFFNAVHKDFSLKDRDLFFGPIEQTDKTIEFEDDGANMTHLLVKVGKFPSLSQARKNGWDKPIPEGFMEHRIGKGKNMVIIWTLNKFPGWDD